MKMRIHFFAAALAVGTAGMLHAQDADRPNSDSTTPGNKPVTILAATNSSESTNGGLESAFSATTLSNLGIDPKLRVVSVMTNRLDKVELERVQIEGGLVPLIKRPSLVTFLQLFNPFAPTEYGGNAPLTAPGFSRAFADPIRTQPTAALFSIGDKPARGDGRR